MFPQHCHDQVMISYHLTRWLFPVRPRWISGDFPVHVFVLYVPRFICPLWSWARRNWALGWCLFCCYSDSVSAGWCVLHVWSVKLAIWWRNMCVCYVIRWSIWAVQWSFLSLLWSPGTEDTLPGRCLELFTLLSPEIWSRLAVYAGEIWFPFPRLKCSLKQKPALGKLDV
jgi:hypothetical protein